MDNRTYFIIDGSHLFASIFTLWREKPTFDQRKLKIDVFSQSLISKWHEYIGMTVRVVFYFKVGDNRINSMLEIPEITKPGGKDHWQIKRCGINVNGIPQEELQKLDPKYRDILPRTEKGVDIKIACDVLKLISNGRAENIVFMINDRDYIPLIETVHELGANTYLAGLDSNQTVQKDLCELMDRYMTLDSQLFNIFGVPAPLPTKSSDIEQINEEIDKALLSDKSNLLN